MCSSDLPAPRAVGAYAPARRIGTTLWVSGVTGRGPDGPGPVGVVGDTVSLDEAQTAARRAAANLLSLIEDTVGLAHVTALGHLRGYVRATAAFERHPAVIDAASQVLAAALGPQAGAHARTALGVASLPGGAADPTLGADIKSVAGVGSGEWQNRSERDG